MFDCSACLDTYLLFSRRTYIISIQKKKKFSISKYSTHLLLPIIASILSDALIPIRTSISAAVAGEDKKKKKKTHTWTYLGGFFFSRGYNSIIRLLCCLFFLLASKESDFFQFPKIRLAWKLTIVLLSLNGGRGGGEGDDWGKGR